MGCPASCLGDWGVQGFWLPSHGPPRSLCPRPSLLPMQNVLAKMVIERVPSVEMVRFVNSGTEACLSVVRLMRAYTGREKVRAQPRGVGAAWRARTRSTRGWRSSAFARTHLPLVPC